MGGAPCIVMRLRIRKIWAIVFILNMGHSMHTIGGRIWNLHCPLDLNRSQDTVTKDFSRFPKMSIPWIQWTKSLFDICEDKHELARDSLME